MSRHTGRGVLENITKFLMGKAAVNFINILRANFTYENLFGSFFYLHVTREKLPKRHLYEIFLGKMLIKLAPGGLKSTNKMSSFF